MHSILMYCVPLLSTVLTAVTKESSPRNILTCDRALGQEAIHNVRDGVAIM